MTTHQSGGRQRFAWSAGIVALCVLLSCSSAPDRPASLLLVTLDTVRADHLSTYGYSRPTAPTLDALARRGVVFDDVIAVAPETQPSSAALLTGQLPAALGIHGNAQPLDARFPTLAEHMSTAGYRTAAFVSGFPLVARLSALDRGFSHYDDTLPDPRGPAARVQRAAEKTAAAAAAWLADLDETTPFFAWVHFYDAHGDYRPIPPYSGRFEPEAPGKPVARARIPRYQRLDDETDAAVYVARYDEEILRVDAALGRLLDGLASRGRLDDTLVAVTADHGESLGEHDYYFDHGNELYAASLRVPFVIAGPGVEAAGTRYPALVAGHDIGPTLLALLGLPALPGASGRAHDLRRAAPNEVLSEARFAPYPKLAEDSDVGPKLSARTRDLTLILRAADGRVELYDRTNDPHEQHDRLRAHDDAALTAELRDAIGRAHTAARRGNAVPTVIDAALRERIAPLLETSGPP